MTQVSRRKVMALGLGLAAGCSGSAAVPAPRTLFGVNAEHVFLSALPRGGRADTGVIEMLGRRGIPFARFAASPQWAGDWTVLDEDPARYWAALDQVFAAAEHSGVRLIPSVLWHPVILAFHCGDTMRAWLDPASRTSRYARNFTQTFAERYDRSPALMMYEFGNELNIHVDDPRHLGIWPPHDPTLPARRPLATDLISSAELRGIVAAFAREIRRLSRRPVETGYAVPRGNAWHMARGSRELDTRAQFIAHLRAVTPPECRVLCIHLYDRLWPWPEAPDTVDGVLSAFVEAARADRRTSLLGEFGVARLADRTEERRQFDQFVTRIQRAGVDLAAVWNVTARPFLPEWDVIDGGDRTYQLDTIAAANGTRKFKW